MLYGIIGFILGAIFGFGVIALIVSRQPIEDRRNWDEEDDYDEDDEIDDEDDDEDEDEEYMEEDDE